jgi:hypothetical protein
MDTYIDRDKMSGIVKELRGGEKEAISKYRKCIDRKERKKEEEQDMSRNKKTQVSNAFFICIRPNNKVFAHK